MVLVVGLAIFGLVILIHELGHFLVGKAFGVKFTSFSIGMGPRILRKRIGDTVYCLSLLPVGGYVRPVAVADIPEPEDSLANEIQRFLAPIDKDEREILAKYTQHSPENVFSKGFWPQFFFAISGAVFNLASIVIVPFLYLTFFAESKIYENSPTLAQITPKSFAQYAGFLPGDQISRVNGEEFKSWTTTFRKLKEGDHSRITFSINRMSNAKVETLNLELFNSLDYYRGSLGDFFDKAGLSPKFTTGHVTPYAALGTSLKIFRNIFRDALYLITASHQAKNKKEALHTFNNSQYGPITGIFEAGYLALQSAGWAITSFIVCSFVAALFNLLPLPALDGGHILLLILEKGFKIPLSLSGRAAVQRFGFCTIMLLTVILLARDLAISVL